MGILKSILFSLLISSISALITSLIDCFIFNIRKKRISKIHRTVLQSLIIFILVIPLLLWASRKIPKLYFMQQNISVSYHANEGLKIEGSFSDRKNMHIYLLVRQILDTEKEVWTVTKEVVSINSTRSTWNARIYLVGMRDVVKPRDIFSIIGVMTDETLKEKALIDTPELKKLKGVITEELEIKIVEVSND